MPFNGVGLFQRVYNWEVDAANNLNVDATRMDTDANDIADGLSNCVTRDGQSPALNNLPMNNFKFTGLGAGSMATDSVNYGQVFNSPAFVTPTATTSPATSDNSLRLATTAMVQQVAFAAALPAQSDGVLSSYSGVAAFSPLLRTGTIRWADSTDLTKRIAINLAGLTTGTTRTITFGDRDVDLGLGYLKVSERQPSGTGGGTAVAADITQTRVLNTVEVNTIPGASLASNQITLPAGTYRYRARAPQSTSQSKHKVFLYNVTDSIYTGIGSNAQLANTAQSASDSVAFGQFTVTATKVFTIRHFTSAGNLGEATGVGQPEVYTEAEFWKVG